MADEYFAEAEGKNFLDLVNDPRVQKDLVRFFKGKRYNYTNEDLKGMTPEEVGNLFVDHMRYQEVNEATVAKDLNFVYRSQKEGDDNALESFGRLMMAWDNSEGAGTGFLDGAADYTMGILSSPSTAATVMTAGLGGPVSKFAGAAAKKAGQVTLRKLLMDRFVKEGAKRVLKDKVAVEASKQSLKSAALQGAVRGAAIEGAIEGGAQYGREEIREEAVDGYEKNMSNVALAAGISAAGGGTLGAFARTSAVKKQNKAMEMIAQQGVLAKRSQLKGAKEAQDKLKNAAANARAAKGKEGSKEYEALKKRTDSLIKLLDKQEKGRLSDLKKPLDVSEVEQGKKIAGDLFEGPDGTVVTTRYTADTFKKIGAATLEIKDKLKFNLSDDVRISQKVADALGEGKIDSKELKALRDKFGMTQSEFSLMFLADMSEAGRTLNFASQMKKGLGESVKEKAKQDIQGVINNLDRFASEGLTNAADDAVLALQRGLTEKSKVVESLREVDAFRVGMMTTQFATAAANVVTGLARIPMDMTNRMFLNVVEGRMPHRNVTDLVKGMTWGSGEASVARILASVDETDNAHRIFQDAMRVEMETGSNSFLSNTTRRLNALNTFLDNQFKEGVFYSSLNRQLSDLNDPKLGRNFSEFVSKKAGLDSLPKGMVEKAKRDALEFSFQYGYEGAQDWFGKGARGVINLNRNVPFLISGAFNTPFPRFIANQMEFMHRYLPTGLAQGLWEKAAGTGSKDVLISSNEKIAKGLTGTMMLLSAIGYRLQADDSTTYRETIDPVSGDVVDMSRALGPFMAHLFIGDLVAKKIKGQDPNKTFGDVAGESLEIATGLNEYGFSLSTAKNLINDISNGSMGEATTKWLADIVAPFTMPLATVRDVQGQFNVDAAPSPYTREIEPEGDITKSQFVQRATRFLPDFNWVQYSSSFNGKNDVPLYDGFSEEPVQKVNPIMSQITGFDTRPKKNEIEQELTRRGLEKWKLLSTRQAKNPNTHLAVLQNASKVMNKEFIAWRENARFTDANLSYDQLDDGLKKRELTNFISKRIQDIRDQVDYQFDRFSRERPKQAVGWIMNNYAIRSKEFSKEFGDLDKVVFYGTGRKMTADEYLDGAENPVQRASNMQKIMQWMEMYENEFRK